MVRCLTRNAAVLGRRCATHKVVLNGLYRFRRGRKQSAILSDKANYLIKSVVPTDVYTTGATCNALTSDATAQTVLTSRCRLLPSSVQGVEYVRLHRERPSSLVPGLTETPDNFFNHGRIYLFQAKPSRYPSKAYFDSS